MVLFNKHKYVVFFSFKFSFLFFSPSTQIPQRCCEPKNVFFDLYQASINLNPGETAIFRAFDRNFAPIQNVNTHQSMRL